MTDKIVGLLLAAGSSCRFGENKLLQPLVNDTAIALQAAHQLLQALPDSLAIVRPEDQALKALFKQTTMQIIDNPHHPRGMSSSIVCGLQASPTAAGWVIALADMPAIPSDVIKRVVQKLQAGAVIVAPTFQGQRGHPVGFGQQFRQALLQLEGDSGARSIVQAHMSQLQTFEVDEPGVVWDIDLERDLMDSEKYISQ